MEIVVSISLLAAESVKGRNERILRITIMNPTAIQSSYKTTPMLTNIQTLITSEWCDEPCLKDIGTPDATATPAVAEHRSESTLLLQYMVRLHPSNSSH